MRTQTRRFTGIIILAVVLGISGCKMPLANEPDGSTGGKQVTLTISTGTVNARTVTVQEGDINIASYKLTAVQGSTTLTETWADLANAQITLETGIWTFILQAFSGASESGEPTGDLLLQGTLTKTISEPTNLAFTMAPATTGTGNVEITITWPETITAVSTVSAKFGEDDYVTEDISSGTYTYTFTKSDVASTSSGILLTIGMMGARPGPSLITVNELVHVYDNLTSRKTIALSETDFNSAPEAPSDLTASREVMSTTVNLFWTDNSTNETAFEIQYSDDDGSNWNDLSTDVSPGATGYDDEGLTRGTTRSYRILAVNGFGASEYSDTAAVTVPWLVTFDKDSEDAVGAMDSEEAADDGTITLPVGTFSRDGYTFAGWTTDRESVMSWPKVPEYDDGESITMTENLNLYAVWWSQSMEMTSFIFRAADNAALSDDVEGVIDGTGIYVTLPPGTDRTDLTPTVTHAGRTCYISGLPNENAFDLSADFTDRVYYVVQAEDGNTTTYRAMVGLSHTLTYDDNGATDGTVPDPNSGFAVTAADNTGTLVRIPTAGTAEAFKFGGWNTAADGTGTSYQPGDIFTITEDITLYVNWVAFEVGDIGPASGYIFYAKSSFSDGWRYLEAAPASTEPSDYTGYKKWANSYTADIFVDETVIGTGQTNTAAIVTALDAQGETDYAAKHCDDLVVGGYDDWFLPSTDELRAMANDLYMDLGLGGFSTDSVYWSSSQCNTNKTYADYVNFANGSYGSGPKDAGMYGINVRAARMF
ncbi:InlB B-repeat-containing protein [Sediminispirochaeta smaragdinae]|uniref:Cell wall/surface repeat protein n=1 Tax=Sediminispirochaeta smaragdinae (strain DSM 11293 / JCM 15392 / SEBR 4228) TaxID=573413 RepID=E1R1D8_SEDSS|nr:InlB B-repeat-containing protein [Sediminispirochaeta smaragdinae]ADK81079.1 cell wall/surface repeat protein [Sediminispirochaeta smaragdinae DSM 11293]